MLNIIGIKALVRFGSFLFYNASSVFGRNNNINAGMSGLRFCFGVLMLNHGYFDKSCVWVWFFALYFTIIFWFCFWALTFFEFLVGMVLALFGLKMLVWGSWRWLWLCWMELGATYGGWRRLALHFLVEIFSTDKHIKTSRE